jgi:hypothetical protein
LLNETLKSIIEANEPDKLEAAAKEFATSVPKGIIMFRYKKSDIDACLMHLSFLSKYAGLFKYELQIEQERHYTITIHHQFGEKWSYWIKETVCIGIFNNILGVAPKVSLSESSLVFSFTLP